MLRWTAAGAVAEPTTLQIRVATNFPGRISAGAPQPSRALSLDEALDNIQYFAVERVGPRVPACPSVVLSGIEDEEGWPKLFSQARALGVKKLTWHQGDRQRISPLNDLVDVLVRVLRHPDQWRPSLETRGPDILVVPLEKEVLQVLGAIVDALVRRNARQVVFQWPFPSSANIPPPAPVAARAIRGAVLTLEGAGMRVRVRGLPPCVLSTTSMAGKWMGRACRTSNRWYVDADHQRDQALSFFPEVVRFAKPDSCRFCAASHRCDGVVEEWLSLGLTGPLTPLGDG